MTVEKVVAFSALVSVNMIIWYEVLGMGFLLWVIGAVVLMGLRGGRRL